jgi:isoquinoline 1-oxidoreductase alpha subunit
MRYVAPCKTPQEAIELVELFRKLTQRDGLTVFAAVVPLPSQGSSIMNTAYSQSGTSYRGWVMSFEISCNGNAYVVDADRDKPLLWVLREDLGLIGTKFACGIGICGACNVLLDGRLVRSCVTEIGSVGSREITTIEGLNDTLGMLIKRAWFYEKVSQCGYCQPGQIMSAYVLLAENPRPTEDEIDAHMTGLCRCGTYQRIKSAIRNYYPSPRRAQRRVGGDP